MIVLGQQQIAHFQAFGFGVVRGLLGDLGAGDPR